MDREFEDRLKDCREEYRLLFSIAIKALKDRFRVEEIGLELEPVPSLKVRFSNSIIWRCIPLELYESGVIGDGDEEKVLIKCDLLDADIGRASYELSFMNTRGEIIFKKREMVRPLELLRE